MRILLALVCVVAAVANGPARAAECSASRTDANEKFIREFIDAASSDYALGERAAQVLRERAKRFMTERYLQHHPGVEDGREAFVQFHVKLYRDHPPQPGAVRVPPAAVVAHCEFVLYAHRIARPDPGDSGRSYDSFLFDLWSIRDHRADEHWDSFLEPWRDTADPSKDPEAESPKPIETAKTSGPQQSTVEAMPARESCANAQVEHNRHLIRELGRIRDGRAELQAVADEVVASDYIERNPMLSDAAYQGRTGFVRALQSMPSVVPGVGLRYGAPEIILPDCNHVATVKAIVRRDYAHPGQSYLTYWFDVWRVKAGRLAEHWDATLKGVDYHWRDVDALNRGASR